MADSKKLIRLKEQGFDVSDKEILRQQRRESKKDKPEPDPLHELASTVERLITEIKNQSVQQSKDSSIILSGVIEALKEGLKQPKPEPKANNWEVEVRDSSNKPKYHMTFKRVEE